MSNAPRFLGTRPLTARSGAVLAVELLVRLGDLEARALAPVGEAPMPLAWTVRRAGRWTQAVDLHAMRALHRGRALAKCCARLERAS